MKEKRRSAATPTTKNPVKPGDRRRSARERNLIERIEGLKAKRDVYMVSDKNIDKIADLSEKITRLEWRGDLLYKWGLIRNRRRL